MKKAPLITKLIILFLPMAVGAFGFIIVAHQPVVDSLYHCLIMYVLNYGGDPPNFFVELARWTAPFATAGSVIFVVSSFRQRLSAHMKYLFSKSVAVYGPEADVSAVLSQLGKSGIAAETQFLKAKTYLLLDSEENNFAFFQAHKDALSHARVYLKCSSTHGQAASSSNLHFFCPEETAARVFWKQHDIYDLSLSRGHRLRIAFLGSGTLTEELVYWGLQNNIFSPQQKIEYHILGHGADFSARYPYLENCGDPVIFHEEDWHGNLQLLKESDLILVTEQSEQFRLVRELLSLLPASGAVVFCADPFALGLLDEAERLTLFNWRKTALDPRYLMDDVLLRRAKQINLRYRHLYGDVPETPENAESCWKELDAFTRYSNISSADYQDVRQKMMARMGIPCQPDASPNAGESFSPAPGQLEFLAELEHIRWCRYHWLNQWHYGLPADGKAKDARLRIHRDLLPYDELSEEEKEKDRETIRVLLSLSEEEDRYHEPL